MVGLLRGHTVMQTWSPQLLSVLRFITGFLFMAHGMQKWLGFPVPPPSPVTLTSLSGAAGLLELVGGPLILIGLFTRPVAFVLSGLMAFAYFIAHAPGGFWPLVNRGELAASTRSCSCIWRRRAGDRGALTAGCAMREWAGRRDHPLLRPCQAPVSAELPFAGCRLRLGAFADRETCSLASAGARRVVDPRLEQRIAHGQHHGSDEDAEEAEG